MVSTKHDAVDFALLSFFDVVNQQNLIALLLKGSFYLSVEVSFFLKIIDQILLAFINKFAIDGCLGIDGNEFFHLPRRHVRDPRQTCSRNPHGDNGTDVHFERDIDPVIFTVILRRVFLNVACQMALRGERLLNQACSFADAPASVWLPWFEKAAGEARAQRTDRVLQSRILICVQTFEGYVSHAGQLSRAHGKSEIDQQVSIIDVGIGLNFCLEVSIVLKEFLQGVLRQSDASLVVRIFIRQIHDLQKTSVGKKFSGSRKIYNAQVICGLQQEIQAQTGKIWNDVYLYFGKLPRTFECGDAGFHLVLRIRLPYLLHHEGSKWLHVAMWISDEIDCGHILSVVNQLGTLHGELRPCRGRQ